MEYDVEISELLQKRIRLFASDNIEAIIKAKKMYKEQTIVLDETNFISVEFKIVEGD